MHLLLLLLHRSDSCAVSNESIEAEGTLCARLGAGLKLLAMQGPM